MNSDPDRERIAKYLMLDLEGLYSLIPPYLKDSVLYHPDVQKEAGRKTFAAIRDQLYRKVCIDARLQNYLGDPSLQDRVNLVIAVADVIASFTMGVPPFLIASIIVRIGLREFCADKPEED